jgi:ATP-dependent helicase/nuclease subunit B
MLRIVTGPFHPVLDHALLEDVRALKSGDPFAPLAIVVPSTQLADRLKRFLAVESRLPLLNLHVLTVHQFALRLRDDLVRSGQPVPPMQLVDDFYFAQLLRQVVNRQLPGLEAMGRLPPSPGTWKGLWATVRDLKDAVVDPGIALKAVAEGLFEEDDRPWLQALFTLQAAVIEGSRSLAVGSPDDLIASLGQDLSRSSLLERFQNVCFYGFYDLLQVQLSFFESVARYAPVTCYVPLGPGPSYDFSRRFFERHLLPLAGAHEDRTETSGASSLSERAELSVTSVIGTEEELATVCREILALVEVHGYRFDDIGVVARSLDPYRNRLQSVFDRHLVPFTSTAGRSPAREPLVKALLQLASLPSNDFECSAVLDVVASPCYRRPAEGPPVVERRPDVWRLAVSALGITKGSAEWARLSASTAPLILQEAAADRGDEGAMPPPIHDPEQVALLSALVTGLIHDCDRLPRRGSIGQLTGAFVELVRGHFAIPGWMESESPECRDLTDSLLAGAAVKRALDHLAELDPVGADLTWEEWMDLFRLALEEMTLPIEGDPHRGVWVIDAMQARGLRFRALFVMGLNEQLFPRVVREDPFLRDRQRLVLESTLGFLIEEKLAGHEEERLLFELLSRAASNRLYLSYQRADEAGRVMAPSAFVAAAQRAPHFVASPERIVPRRLTERVASQPAIQEVLPAQDLAVNLLLHEQDAGPLFDHTGQYRALFEHGVVVQGIMERDAPDLGPFDGMVGAGASSDTPLDRRGLSPTALERYATCPFQYFADKRLRLKPVRPMRQEHLPALTLGTLIHAALRLSYERLMAAQWPDAELDRLTLKKIIADSTAEVFAGHAAVSGTGHALIWTLAQEQVVELVTLAVASDQEDYRATGYRPQAFEIGAEGLVPLGDETAGLAIHGTLDRLDVRQNPPGLRIVDYKFKQGSEMETKDRNLLLGATRGARLQPPLYAWMTLPSLPDPAEVQLLYLAPRWDPPIARSIFERAWLSGKTGETITQTIRTLVQGIERQEFFILPDGYCDQCAFSSACRRYDTAAWWRSYRSPQARVLRRLRKLQVNDE